MAMRNNRSRCCNATDVACGEGLDSTPGRPFSHGTSRTDERRGATLERVHLAGGPGWILRQIMLNSNEAYNLTNRFAFQRGIDWYVLMLFDH
jgi:hypothetical protein